MENQHTYGEWEAVRKEGTHIHKIMSQGKEIAETIMPYGHSLESRADVCRQAEANAQLIAAAPDLLEALKQAFKLVGPPSEHSKSSDDGWYEVSVFIEDTLKKAIYIDPKK